MNATVQSEQLMLPLTEPLPADVRPMLESRIATGWRNRAACVDVNPALFDDPDEHPHGGRQYAAVASAICHSCPVRRSCLFTALLGDEHGIWGGHTSADRDDIRAHLANPLRRAAILSTDLDDATPRKAAA